MNEGVSKQRKIIFAVSVLAWVGLSSYMIFIAYLAISTVQYESRYLVWFQDLIFAAMWALIASRAMWFGDRVCALFAPPRGDELPFRVPRFVPGLEEGANVISLDSEDGRQHLFVIGSTGRGRSSRLMAEATRRGIAYDKLLKQLEPSEEEKQAMREKEQARAQHELIRLNAVRQAYWTQTDPEDSDLWVLHDALTQIDGLVSPSREQQRIVFFMLPADVIGNGIAWGFSDTEVRSSVWKFVDENKAAVAAAIGHV